ncbi:MAG: hypothetical protein AAF146_22880 [Bacteroidota bacterium]
MPNLKWSISLLLLCVSLALSAQSADAPTTPPATENPFLKTAFQRALKIAVLTFPGDFASIVGSERAKTSNAMEAILGSDRTDYDAYVDLYDAADVLVREEKGQRAFLVLYEEMEVEPAKRAYEDLKAAIATSELACGKVVVSSERKTSDDEVVFYLLEYTQNPLYALTGTNDYENIAIRISLREEMGKSIKTGEMGAFYTLKFEVTKQ